tara:strand:+ start:669 stop:1313 length:645 start_codon:yes stop_codon:yes gene_type:complete
MKNITKINYINILIIITLFIFIILSIFSNNIIESLDNNTSESTNWSDKIQNKYNQYDDKIENEYNQYDNKLENEYNKFKTQNTNASKQYVCQDPNFCLDTQTTDGDISKNNMFLKCMDENTINNNKYNFLQTCNSTDKYESQAEANDNIIKIKCKNQSNDCNNFMAYKCLNDGDEQEKELINNGWTKTNQKEWKDITNPDLTKDVKECNNCIVQ